MEQYCTGPSGQWVEDEKVLIGLGVSGRTVDREDGGVDGRSAPAYVLVRSVAAQLVSSSIASSRSTGTTKKK